MTNFIVKNCPAFRQDYPTYNCRDAANPKLRCEETDNCILKQIYELIKILTKSGFPQIKKIIELLDIQDAGQALPDNQRINRGETNEQIHGRNVV